jgi:hypothetical protein
LAENADAPVRTVNPCGAGASASSRTDGIPPELSFGIYLSVRRERPNHNATMTMRDMA